MEVKEEVKHFVQDDRLLMFASIGNVHKQRLLTPMGKAH